jgi:hypothetical protein
MIETISDYFSDFNNIKAIMSGKYARDELEKKLKENKISRSFRRKSKKLLKGILPTILDSNKADMLMSYQILCQNIQTSLPKIVKDGHIKGLSKGLTPEPRVEDYMRLKWFVYDCAKSLILGDVGCLSETMEGKFKFLTFKGDEIRNIFLPIAENQILISTSLSETPHVDFNIINNEIAKCSREFFICSKYSPDICSLVPLLGSETEIISKEELGSITK